MSFETVSNTIRSRFKTEVADVESISVQYDNSPKITLTEAIWARWKIRPGVSMQADFGSSTKRHRTFGLAIAQVFAPVNSGTKDLLSVIDTIVAAFKAVQDGTVVFRTPSVSNIGRTGKWWQMNVECPWQVDETS
jgi:hypothetical protein